MGSRVSKIHVAVRIRGDLGGLLQNGPRARAAIPDAPPGTVQPAASDGGDDSVGRHTADAIVAPVGDIHVPGTIEGDVGRSDRRARRLHAVAGIAVGTV